VCVCVCDISSLRVNGPSEPGRLRDVCVCQWVKHDIGLPQNDLSGIPNSNIQT